MDRKPTLKERAEHILNAINHIKKYVDGVDEQSFVNNSQLQSAVQYQFLIIGEAVRHIDFDILEKYEYPWHIPKSFRNYIIHVYHGVKMERIYTATQELDELENQIISILEKEF